VFAKVKAPVLLPTPDGAGETPAVGVMLQAKVPGAPPVALNVAMPPAPIAVGEDGEITTAAGTVHEGATTVCWTLARTLPGGLHPEGDDELIERNVTV
jgi:hypothetical protein